MDIFKKEKRSDIMRAVRSTGNKSTEIALIKIFREYNVKGWRRNYKLFGNPDFVFPTKRIAIFVDGCFWHGHNCRKTTPEDNKEYWENKKHRNIVRDKKVNRTLRKLDWIVIRLWECELKKNKYKRKINRIKKILDID